MSTLPTLYLKGNLISTQWSESQEYLDQQIPLIYIMRWFDDRIPKESGEVKIPAESVADRILILRSSTGSGKSTTIPPELFHLFFHRLRRNIACTQPKVLTAIDIPRNTIPPFHTKEMLTKMGLPEREPLIYGRNIGTQTGMFTKKPVKGIIFMTPGIIVQQMNVMTPTEFMEKYGIIIVDEAHERSIEIDMVLYLMKKFVHTYYLEKQCPFLVIMSATFDPFKYADYLMVNLPVDQRYKNIVDVKGMTHPIEEIYLPFDATDYIQLVVDTCVEIHTKNKNDFATIETKSVLVRVAREREQKFRDILIFVKGAGEIRRLKEKIARLNSSHKFFHEFPVLPLGLTGELVQNLSQEYRDAVERDLSELWVQVGKDRKRPTRRVIIATNVAETGITLETLRYVIDTGFVNIKEFNPNFSCTYMMIKSVTQSMHQQRRGRVGRKAPGVCYSLFTEKTFTHMIGNQFPDIIRNDVTTDLLNILIKEFDKESEVNKNSIYQLFVDQERTSPEIGPEQSEVSAFQAKLNQQDIDIYRLDLLDLPGADSLHYSMDKLYALGCINRNSVPTSIGFIINKFRFIAIESRKMILSGYAWGAPIMDLITIAAFLEFTLKDLLSEEDKANYQKSVARGHYAMFKEKRVIGYPQTKTTLFVNDEFIHFIFIFQEFISRILEFNLADLKETDVVKEIKIWCKDNGLNLNTILEVIELRENIISNMLIIGLDPYYLIEKSYSHTHVADFSDDREKLNYIKSIKQCIFEGYRCNLATWNRTDQTYYVKKTGLPLIIKSELIQDKFQIERFGDTNPRFLIFNAINYKFSQKTNQYECKVDYISILDGYLTIDPYMDSLV